jgi:hypothetical protein
MTKPKKGETVLLVGTGKGAFLFHSPTRRRWDVHGPFFEGLPVYHAIWDGAHGRRIFAAVNSTHWGPTIQRSTSFGVRWARGEKPPRFPKASGLAVQNVWHLAVGTEPGVLWAGVEPAGLFRSTDDGTTFRPIRGLNGHPTRDQWQPGGGGLVLHSILPHPKDEDRLHVAVSAAGTFATEDGGATWTPENAGVRADFLPTRYPEVGQCVHREVRDGLRPDRTFQQNHCGVYRRDPGKGRWRDISRGLPSRFGFPMAAHPRRENTVYVVPLKGDFARVPPEDGFGVWRTEDGGRTWRKGSRGLPKTAYVTVLRDALAADAADPTGVYVGTKTGQIFASRDEGRTWTAMADYLPPVLSLETGVVGR